MTDQTRSAVVAMVGKWHFFEGCAYGCTAPVIRGLLVVRPPRDVFFTLIDKAFEERFKGTLTSRATASNRPADGILHRVLQWSVLLQRAKKVPVGKDYRILSPVQNGNPTHIALPYVHPNATISTISILCRVFPAMLAAEKSLATLLDIMESLDKEVTAALAQYAEPGQNRTALLQIALDRNIPIDTADRKRTVFGAGIHALRLESTTTGRDSVLGFKYANDKHVTGLLLRQAGLPGANNRPVGSLDQAKAVAKEVGYPVVVKPRDQEQGKGVFADIRSEEVLEWAYARTEKVSSNILIEKHFEGWGHRISLHKGILLSATRKIPAGVTGDGKSTIRGLIDLTMTMREKERKFTDARHQALVLDDEALGILREHNYTPDSILDEGVFVALRRKNNSTVGGRVEVLEISDIHPDNLQLCKDAAATLGLETAGVDLLIPDISQSWAASGALICEINGAPQLGYSAAENFMQALFPDGGQIPVHLVLVHDPAQISDAALRKLGDRLGCDVIVRPDCLIVQGQSRPRRFERGYDAFRAALSGSGASSLVAVLSFDDVAACGLPVGRIEKLFVVSNQPPAVDSNDTMKIALSMIKSNCGEIIPLSNTLEIES